MSWRSTTLPTILSPTASSLISVACCYHGNLCCNREQLSGGTCPYAFVRAGPWSAPGFQNGGLFGNFLLYYKNSSLKCVSESIWEIRHAVAESVFILDWQQLVFRELPEAVSRHSQWFMGWVVLSLLKYYLEPLPLFPIIQCVFAPNQMIYGHDSSRSWLAWFHKDFLKRQWSEWMGNSFPEPEPLSSLLSSIDL